jgi:hypothetical protein
MYDRDREGGPETRFIQIWGRSTNRFAMKLKNVSKNLHSVSFPMSDVVLLASHVFAMSSPRPPARALRASPSALRAWQAPCRHARRPSGETPRSATCRCLRPMQCCAPQSCLPAANAPAHAHAHSSLIPIGPGLYAPGQSDSVLSPKKDRFARPRVTQRSLSDARF